MEKKLFVVEAQKPGMIGEYSPQLAILAENVVGAKKLLKEVGHKYGVTAADYGIFYNWRGGPQTRCELTELPLLEKEETLISA